MKTAKKRRCESGYITLIIAILVIIVGAIVIYQLARLLHSVFPNPGTNNYSVYTETNVGYPQVVQIPLNDASYVLQGTNISRTFTFSYGLWNSNNLWLSVTTPPPPTAGGDVTVLIDTTNEYAIAINMGTYDLYLDYDAVTGDQIENSSNGICPIIIEKSTNLLNWLPIYTNQNCVPGNVQQFTDTNAVESTAFYKILLP
jgi:hypothetical protein